MIKIPAVIVPIIAVILMKDFLPFRSVVSTVYVRWTAIKIQIARMEMVGMMKANEDAVQTQASLKIKNIMLLYWWWYGGGYDSYR